MGEKLSWEPVVVPPLPSSEPTETESNEDPKSDGPKSEEITEILDSITTNGD